MSNILFKCFVLVITGFPLIQCRGFYNIIGSRNIRPNSDYHIAVSTLFTSEPTTVTATIEGIFDNGTSYHGRDSTEVLPYTSQVITLSIENIRKGDYKMVVSGRGGVDFLEDFPVQFLAKEHTVFIQTDKPTYKPGSKILFRVIVLNSQLQPTPGQRYERLHIVATDSKGNRVKEWNQIEAKFGTFTGEIELSTETVLGNWNISVTIHDETYSKTVQVAEYVVSQFIVDVEAPKHLTFKEKFLNVKVNSRYHYGADVNGQATVSVFPTIFSGVIQPIFESPFRKVVPINGSASVQFDILNELKLSDEYERTIVIDVIIEEAMTGRRQNNSIEIYLHKYEYKMDLIPSAEYFKPGLPYIAFVKISNHDKNLGDKNTFKSNEILVRYGYSKNEEQLVEDKYKIDKNGLAKLQIYTPANVSNATALWIEVEYEGLKERTPPIAAAQSYSNTFLQIISKTDHATVNRDVEISINCTEPISYIDYVIFGRGDIQAAKTLRIGKTKDHTFHFLPTHKMAPIAHLLVTYVREDGEMVGDSLDIEIDGLLQNFMDIKVDPAETEPNLYVDLTIQAQSNSYIALMAVDERVTKLNRNFDLDRNDIFDEMKRYDLAKASPYTPVWLDSKNHQFFWKPGAANPHNAIYDSGGVLVTNSHINRHKPTVADVYLRPVVYDSSTVKPDHGFGLALHPVTRPPLAGPYAFSRIPRPVWNHPKVYLNEDLADTWLFFNFTLGPEGKSSLRRKVPNTSTKWVLSGYSLHPSYGLGLVETKKMVEVSKSFEVDLNLPSSVQRGEVLNVPVVVRNHGNRDVRVDVTMYNPEQKFEFVEINQGDNATKPIELYKKKKVNVAKNSQSTLYFMLRVKQQGLLEIKVTASSVRNQDVVLKNLLVKAEGETEYFTKTLLIDLRTNGSYKNSINFTLPANLVRGTEQITASAVGDLFGSTIVNLGHLIRIPKGCGEANLVNLYTNLIVLNYFKSKAQNTPSIEEEALHLLEMAYQSSLRYQRPDGTFTPFGTDDEKSNVFMTAYTTMGLILAKNYIFVDEKIISRGLEWLTNDQDPSGSYSESGEVIYESLQKSNGKSLALTAFTLLAFIESGNSQHINTINKGLDYIAKYIDEEESTYTIALCSYVLHLTRHTSKQSVLNLLNSRAKSRGSLKWWTGTEEQNISWHNRSRSVDTETTAYALLSLIEAGYLEDALPVLNWIMDQQTSIGGFSSTRDTITALWAIYKLSSRLNSDVDMRIEFQHREQGASYFNINRNNAMIIQSLPLSKDVRKVNVTAKGRGLALFKINYHYNMNVTGAWPLFYLDPQIDKNSDKDRLQLSICTAFVSANLTGSSKSNMAVMEVNFPSGFIADIDALPSLEVSERVERVETDNDLNKVILYFEYLANNHDYCPTVSAFRVHKVAAQKPVSVVVWDYYDTSRRARLFYRGAKISLCDICEGPECDKCNELEAKPQIGEKKSDNKKGGDTRIIPTIFWPFLAIFFLSTCT